ncbi:MAG: glucose 1-dehydrogenase [Proteobacteria bacterium]|nr:glucose 1-dehydrogenase [Pseudomonadota bacterium]MBU4471645.1 glucose 1-dehydrogenase [Pseudomonadota bacterium]
MIMERFRLDQKVALITGGSRGIGRAIALCFAGVGADIVIAARKQEQLDATSSEITSLGRRCLAVTTHAAKVEALDNLIEKTMEEMGRIDILVCNAATNPQNCPVIETDEWAWDAVMNLNLKGYFLLSQRVAKIMKEQGGGVIIFIGSTNAFQPNRGVGVYSVSKAGEHALAQVLAYELGQFNIRVNTLAPGATRTDMTRPALKTGDSMMEKEISKRTAMGRIAETEDMEGAALFLASDAGRFVTGQILVVDGGAVTYIY